MQRRDARVPTLATNKLGPLGHEETPRQASHLPRIKGHG